MEQIGTWIDGLAWPSVSFAVLITSLLLSAYVLWRRFQSRKRLIRRVAELEALSGAGRAIVESALDVLRLCELIATEAGKVIDNSTFQIGLFEDSSYTILFWTVNGRRRRTPRTFDLSESRGVVGWIRDNRHPVLVRDLEKELNSLPANPRYLSEAPPRASLFVPLISAEEVIGIIAAQSDQPNRFNEEDLRRLMILANQAAAAIAHAQLYEQAQRRATHLELVNDIAHQINAVQEQEEIFDQVVQLTGKTFGFSPVIILEFEPDSNELVLKASNAEEALEREIRLNADQGIMGAAASTRQVIISNNTVEDERFVSQIPGRPETLMDTRSELAIPLIADDEVLGVLDVQSPHLGAFSPADITALEALAAETAMAVNKARQLVQQREQAWTTSAQLQVAEAIDRSENLEEVIAAVTRLTQMLVGVDFCGILLWDAEMELYRGATLYGPERAIVEAFRQTRLAIGDWGPLDAIHVGQETLATSQIPPWLDGHDQTLFCGVVMMPISARNEVLGVMIIGSPASQPDLAWLNSNAAGAHRRELLENIRQQTAQAIRSARLRAAQQEEAWVNTALLQVAEAVNLLTNVNDILDTIVRLVPMLVGVGSALILIWDEESRTYRAGPSHGISEMGLGLVSAHGIEEDEFLSLRARSAEFLTPSSVYYSMRLPPWLVKVLGTSIAHAFPLYARGRLVGVMLVGTAPEDTRLFSARRLSILNGIAQQAATALVNDQLYRESAERSRLEREIEVAREIQASLLPSGSPDVPGCSVASLWLAARQVSGDFYDFLHLPDGRWSIIIADVADKGVPAAIFMTLSRTILRTVAFNRADPAEVLMRTNQIIDADSSSELFVTVFYAIWDPSTKTLTYANGGHNPPILMSKDGACRLLAGKGMALGVLPHIDVESKSIRIYPGDTILFYTDGVTEAMNEDYDEFGMERLRMTAKSAKDLDPAGIIERVTTAIGEHAGVTPQFDDITMVVMKSQ